MCRRNRALLGEGGGPVAQSVEHCIRIAGVRSSNLLGSTKQDTKIGRLFLIIAHHIGNAPMSQLILFLVPLSLMGFWFLFFYYYSWRFPTPREVLFFSFVVGISSAVLAGLLEGYFFQNFISIELEKVFFAPSFTIDIFSLLFPLIVSFALIAPIEETMKFLLITFFLFKRKRVTRVIDGLNIGIMVGLGFGLVENLYMLNRFLTPDYLNEDFGLFLLVRFFATGAHTFFAGTMGYFLGLAQSNRLFSERFFVLSIVLPILLHGLFNFFIFAHLASFSLALAAILLLFLFKWYTDRQNFQQKICENKLAEIIPPLFAPKHELDTLFFQNNINLNLLKNTNVCPFCFRKIKQEGLQKCPFCKVRLISKVSSRTT